MDRFITISVDDGHVTDLKAAELLNKYGLDATFYVPVHNPERPVMPAAQIRELAVRFEIGAHTLNHVPLTSVSQARAWTEIVEGKHWLENTVGKAVLAFCYPRGKFNTTTALLVKKAGFVGARTCFFNLHDFPRDPFRWGVSTHAHVHSKALQVRHALLEGNFRGMWNFFRYYNGETDWKQQFFNGLEQVAENGGIAHLYLHSWEIEQGREWDNLESVFAAIAQRRCFKPITNGGLFNLWNTRHTRRVVECCA